MGALTKLAQYGIFGCLTLAVTVLCIIAVVQMTYTVMNDVERAIRKETEDEKDFEKHS